jgi:hypothetical protein
MQLLGSQCMKRVILLLYVAVATTSLLAQSADTDAVHQEKYALFTLMKYCAGVEEYSTSQQPRVFAQVSPSAKSSPEWLEFVSTTAWMRAGSPYPLALVWYKDGNAIRVTITASGHSGEQQEYADYCYRPNGNLARLRSEPRTQIDCDRSLLQCRLTLREERLYPPKGQLAEGVLERDAGNSQFVVVRRDEDSLPRPLRSEITWVVAAPMNWLEYLTVSELPFYPLQYASGK